MAITLLLLLAGWGGATVQEASDGGGDGGGDASGADCGEFNL